MGSSGGKLPIVVVYKTLPTKTDANQHSVMKINLQFRKSYNFESYAVNFVVSVRLVQEVS